MTPPLPPLEHVQALGRELFTLKRTAAYSVIATTVALGLFGILLPVYLHGERLIALAVAALIVGGTIYFLDGQRSAFLVIHENGIRVGSRRTQEVVLWHDVSEVNPTFSYVAHPNTIIDLEIRRVSGGRIVLRNNWKPRDPFYSLVRDLLQWPEDAA